MLASSLTMSASGTDQISGTSAKMSRPRPGPTEWINVSVVYGPPDVEKKRTKTSPSVPIPRGSFCLIDHASITNCTNPQHAKCLRKARTQESFFEFIGEVVETAASLFVLPLARAVRSCGKSILHNIVSTVIPCDLGVLENRCG